MVKKIWKSTLIITIICVIVTSAVVVTNRIARPFVEKHLKQQTDNARAEVLGDSSLTFEEINISEYNLEGLLEGYLAMDEDGELQGLVFTAAAKGYGGDIIVMVGFTKTGEITDKSIKIMSDNETPGLGKKINQPDFLSKFSFNLNALGEEGFKIVKTKPEREDELSAITGATISSKAVAEAVNITVKAAKMTLS